MSISFNPEMCPSTLNRITICQVTNSTHLWRYTTFLKGCSQNFSLFRLPLRHISLQVFMQGALSIIKAWLLSVSTPSDGGVRNAPPCAACSQSLLKTVHPEVINTYISHTIFISWCSKCLSEPGGCIAATLRVHCGSFLFTCEETRIFYIYFLKWSHIKELRKKAIQS